MYGSLTKLFIPPVYAKIYPLGKTKQKRELDLSFSTSVLAEVSPDMMSLAS